MGPNRLIPCDGVSVREETVRWGSPRARWSAAVVAVWLAGSLPLALADVLPFVDYPAHLARVHLLAGGLSGTESFYQPAWTLLPNLALEVIAVPLSLVLPAPVALQIVCVLVVALLVLGGALLSRAATGRMTPLAFLPALLVYNVIFAFGFLNFLFGLGVALIALARHIERADQPLGRRVLRESLFALVLFFSHIVALVVYLVAAAVHDLASRRPQLRRDAAVLAAALVAPTALLLASPTRSEARRAAFQPLASKLDKLLDTPATGQGIWDTAFALAVLAFIAVLLLLRLARPERRLGIVALALAGLFLLSPYRFAIAENVDTRLPLVFLLVALASFQLTCSGARARAVAAALAVLFAFRVTTTSVHHVRSGRAIAAVRADLAAAVPAGSLLFTAREVSAPSWRPDDWNPPLTHAADLLLLDRPVFAATLFAHTSQQPIARSRPFAALEMPEPVGLVWQPHLEAYGKNLLRLLAETRRPEPAYVLFLKGPGRLIPGPYFDVVVDRPPYAILRLIE
jgi:hypothetical protein